MLPIESKDISQLIRQDGRRNSMGFVTLSHLNHWKLVGLLTDSASFIAEQTEHFVASCPVIGGQNDTEVHMEK